MQKYDLYAAKLVKLLCRGKLCKQVTDFYIVSAVDVTTWCGKRIASLVLFGTARCLHSEMGYELNGTKLRDINKACSC